MDKLIKPSEENKLINFNLSEQEREATVKKIDPAHFGPRLDETEMQLICTNVVRYPTREITPALSPLKFLKTKLDILDITNVGASTLSKDLVPTSIKTWIMDISERAYVNPEIVLIPALASFAAIAAKKIGIFPKKYDTWLVVPQLWGAIVTNPGYATTQAIEEALIPFRRIRKSEDLVVKKDLIHWLRGISKVEYEERQEFFDKEYDHSYLSIFGRIEPHKLENYVNEISNKNTDDDMLRYFQLLVFNNNAERESMDKRPNLIARESVFEIFKTVNNVASMHRQNISGVRFSVTAQSVFNDWLIELEYKIRLSGKDHPLLVSHLRNYRLLMPSLALLFWILERPENIHGWGAVSLSATQCAVKWCRFLESHALRVYDKTPSKIAHHEQKSLCRTHPSSGWNNSDDEMSIFDSAFKMLTNAN